MREKHLFPGSIGLSLLILSVMLLFSGCGRSPQEAIVGKWNMSGEETTLEFQADGTLISTDPSGEVTSGTYTFVDEHRVRLRLESSEVVVQVDIRGNQMSLVGSSEAGSRASFLTRVPQ